MESDVKGIDLSRRYFTQLALPLIRAHFPHIASRCAAGLCTGGLDVGCGSEVYGYDDGLSRDHNWGARFFLFLNESDYIAQANNVRMLLAAKLPLRFEEHMMQPTTGQATNFHVTTPLRNALAALDVESLPVSDEEWFAIPEAKLSEYAAGVVYWDPLDILGPLKRRYAAYPRDVLLKRLSGALFMTHTAGNALRCQRRGEWMACRLYLDMAISSVQRAVLLLRGRFPPHVKWRSRMFRELSDLPPEWVAHMERLALRLDPKTMETDVLTLLGPLGEMINAAGLIPTQPIFIDNNFLRFNCYGFSKTLEMEIRGELAGRILAVSLDQAVESFLPLSAQALRTQWRAGRPGIAKLITP